MCSCHSSGLANTHGHATFMLPARSKPSKDEMDELSSKIFGASTDVLWEPITQTPEVWFRYSTKAARYCNRSGQSWTEDQFSRLMAEVKDTKRRFWVN